MVHCWAWQGMQTPWRRISTAPIVCATVVLDLAPRLFNDCISILWRLTGTLRGPAFVWLQYQNVLMSCPQLRPSLSLLTRRGKVRWYTFCYCRLMPDLQVRLFFNGSGRYLLLMYNLLWILFTLKREHVEALVILNVMNTKLRCFFGGGMFFHTHIFESINHPLCFTQSALNKWSSIPCWSAVVRSCVV